MTQSGLSRRRLLTGITVASVGIAGCSETPASATGEQFESVAVENATLVVSLADGTSLTQVNVIAPDGTDYTSTDVVDGQTRLEISLGTTYEPGEYRLVGEPRGEESIIIHPDLQIREFGAGVNNPDRMPSALGTTVDKEAFVVIENRGTGPTAIQTLEFNGNIPNPTESLSDQESGIFDSDAGPTGADAVPLGAGAQLTLFSNTLPFFFAGEEATCSSMPETGTVTVTVEHSVQADPTTANFRVTYEHGSSDTCDITIGERVS